MEIVYNDEYMKVEFNRPLNIIEHTWKSTSEKLDDNDFRRQLGIFQNIILEKKPKAISADTKEFLFTLSPMTQEWIAATFFPAIIAIGVKKYALQVSADIFTQVSVEQVVENQVFATRYFENAESAREWAAS